MADELKATGTGLEIQLIPGSDGIFEVTYEGKLLFSKKAAGRFPNPGEVPALIGR